MRGISVSKAKKRGLRSAPVPQGRSRGRDLALHAVCSEACKTGQRSRSQSVSQLEDSGYSKRPATNGASGGRGCHEEGKFDRRTDQSDRGSNRLYGLIGYRCRSECPDLTLRFVNDAHCIKRWLISRPRRSMRQCSREAQRVCQLI